MSSHELKPASSQPTKASTALPARTISSMPARNRHMPRKKRGKARSRCRLVAEKRSAIQAISVTSVAIGRL
jgi:hypothetical protein